MTEAQMKAAAIAEAQLYAVPECTPVITAAFYGIVDRHRRARVHAVSTAYVYGEIIQPSTRNGHRYRCVVAGTSDSTVPTFPCWDSSGITDGTVSWIEAGPDYDNVYDVRAICHDAWIAKAAASSHLVSRSSGNARTEYSLLQEQCRKRAMDFSPLEIA